MMHWQGTGGSSCAFDSTLPGALGWRGQLTHRVVGPNLLGQVLIIHPRMIHLHEVRAGDSHWSLSTAS